MRKPTVLLDCDGVLSDFIGGVLDIVERVTGLSFAPHDVDQFDFCAALNIRGMDASLIKQAIAEPGFCASLAPYDGARSGVDALREVAEIYVVTSPWNSCPTWTHEREAWLWRHFKIPASHVVHTSAKHLVCGDVFVDDKTSSVVKWREAWPDRFAAQWETPHNRQDDYAGLSFSSWSQVANLAAAMPELA